MTISIETFKVNIMNKKPKCLLYIVVSVVTLVFVFNFPLNTFAQTSGAGVATYVPVAGSVSDGMILCGSDGGSNKPCDREYDPNMIGVVTSNPAISFATEDTTGSTPILSSGEMYVFVSADNGPIGIGDFITSSRKPGVGQKAKKSGYILGSALEEYSDTSNDGKIKVSLTLKPAVLKKNAEANLLQMLRDGVEGAFESPLSALRYVVAAIITSVTFIYGFIHFGRIAKSGVESIGRNPLASKSIQLGVIMNMGITVAIMAGSIFVSYLILVF